MGRVGRFILKVAAVLILIVSAGTFALSLFTGETRNGDNLQSEFDYLITVGISQSGEESSWKDANTASFMDTFVKSNGYEAVYADAGSDQEKQIEDVEGFIKQGVDYIILNPISEIGWDDVLEDAKKAHIPVILVNNGVDTDDSSLYSCMLGSDYGKQMKKAGKWLDEYLKEEDEKKAEKVMKLFLEQEPDLRVVFAESDEMALGAIDAIGKSGKTCGEDGDIIVISFGGSKEGIEAVKEGKLNVTFECNPGQGPKAAELIQRLESDISIDKEQYVEETYFDGTMDLDEIIENRTY